MTGETFFQLHYHLTDTERLFDLAQGIAARRRRLKKHDARCRRFSWYARGLLRRGIAFLIPLSSVGGKKVLQYLTVGQKIEIEEESTLQNTEYELLVAIANSGYTEVIMDAARSAHAPGGTVLHAKGTGAEHAERFLGISLAEEKEMVFIVVKAARKNAIMRAIMEQAGTDSKAGTVVFSLPVTETAGLRMMEEMDED